MLIPICKNCRVEMQCEKNAQMVNDPESGPFPSTYWVGDVFKCPSCFNEIITGFCQKGYMKEEMKSMGRDISDSIEFKYGIDGVEKEKEFIYKCFGKCFGLKNE